MDRLQARILGMSPALDATSPKELLRQVRKALNDAIASGELKIPQDWIHRHVTLEHRDEQEFVIVGGIKDFRRRDESARLIRDDLAWLHFTMTLRCRPHERVEMLAYDFELVFPADHVPPWVRIDLNPPGHENDARGLRSHVHPGNDELQLPAPLMTPIEILELMIHRLRPRDSAHPRM